MDELNFLASLQGIEPRSALLESDIMPLYQRDRACKFGRSCQVRTDDILRVRQTLYQLS